MTVRIIFDAEDESIVGERIEDDAWDGAYASRFASSRGDVDAMRAYDANVMYEDVQEA